jgi:hypothetical protein
MADLSLRLATDAACVICHATTRRMDEHHGGDKDLELSTICLAVLGRGQ